MISCWCPLIFLLQKTFKLFGLQICWLWAYLMTVIAETHRVHLIWYLRFYCMKPNSSWIRSEHLICSHFVVWKSEHIFYNEEWQSMQTMVQPLWYLIRWHICLLSWLQWIFRLIELHLINRKWNKIGWFDALFFHCLLAWFIKYVILCTRICRAYYKTWMYRLF